MLSMKGPAQAHNKHHSELMLDILSLWTFLRKFQVSSSCEVSADLQIQTVVNAFGREPTGSSDILVWARRLASDKPTIQLNGVHSTVGSLMRSVNNSLCFYECCSQKSDCLMRHPMSFYWARFDHSKVPDILNDPKPSEQGSSAKRSLIRSIIKKYWNSDRFLPIRFCLKAYFGRLKLHKSKVFRLKQSISPIAEALKSDSKRGGFVAVDSIGR